jgi:hypothetical protein
MIAPPARVIASPRTPAPAGDPLPDLGETDAAEALPTIEARIAALVARASTPEDEALEKQREEFDLVTRVRAELERETNALRDMAMEQMKNDDEILKKWIALI